MLQLQLKRFEYDFQRDTMVKVWCRSPVLLLISSLTWARGVAVGSSSLWIRKIGGRRSAINCSSLQEEQMRSGPRLGNAFGILRLLFAGDVVAPSLCQQT